MPFSLSKEEAHTPTHPPPTLSDESCIRLQRESWRYQLKSPWRSHQIPKSTHYLLLHLPSPSSPWWQWAAARLLPKDDLRYTECHIYPLPSSFLPPILLPFLPPSYLLSFSVGHSNRCFLIVHISAAAYNQPWVSTNMEADCITSFCARDLSFCGWYLQVLQPIPLRQWAAV